VFGINYHCEIKISPPYLVKQFTRRRNNKAKVNISVLRAKRCHRIVQVMHRRSIDHSNPYATNATLFRSSYPAGQIAGVGDDALRVGKNFVRLFSQKLSPSLSLKQWEPQAALEFGQSLRERRGRHAEG
jgi:hypothetical protein